MDPLIITTKNGKIRGKVVHLNVKDGKSVYVFRNVPFAKPPVGQLRFMPPQSADPWTGIRDGTTVGNVPMYSKHLDEVLYKCLPMPSQLDVELVTSEDCLHLSIYTTLPQSEQKLPVMVWLYGGGFGSGSERLYDGCPLAGMNDVVVVVPNYRVGIFGFFSLGQSSACPGNAGLLDQCMALKWVQENIEKFGGDKNNVTIFGESAGGVSVNHHIISPKSRDLFHKAISHSGQSTMPGLFKTSEDNFEQNQCLFKLLDIEGKNDNKILEALQKISAEDLVKMALKVEEQRGSSFLPCFDGNFFGKTPEESLEDEEFSKVPYIIGCNNTEGHGLLPLLSFPKIFYEGITEEQARKLPFFQISESGLEECKKFYPKHDQDDKRFSKLFGDMIGDSMFVSKAVQSASVYADGGAPVYMYYGAFQMKMFHDNQYGPGVQKKPEWCSCDHADDVFMTFGLPFSTYKLPLGAKFAREEEDISQKFMTYLTNFAKTGDPNIGKSVEVKWPKYERRGEHLNVANPFSVGKDLAPKETEFWNVTMPPYMK